MAIQKNQLLHQPPVNYPLMGSIAENLDKEFNVSKTWQNYFTNVTGTFNQFFPIVTSQDANGIAHTSIPQAPHLTQDEIDALQNAPDGATVYNSTTNKMNFRENGAWKEIT